MSISLLKEVREMLIFPYPNKQESDRSNALISAIDAEIDNPDHVDICAGAIILILNEILFINNWQVDVVKMGIKIADKLRENGYRDSHKCTS